MPPSHTILIAGAGIAGLTAALALARRGFRVVVLDAAERLSEAGAGIQLSPNATQVLIELGVGAKLARHTVAPEAIHIRDARHGQTIARLPLGEAARFRYGAPFWLAHRADLQAALLEAVGEQPDINLRLGSKVVDFAPHNNGVTITIETARTVGDDQGIALVGADGLWSSVRQRLGHSGAPRFCRRVAWRAAIPADAVADHFREPTVNLWLGAGAHLVHYPVRSGSAVNIVAIVSDGRSAPGWSVPGCRNELLDRFARWPRSVRDLLALPPSWQTWALYDRRALRHWGTGPVTLIGDAAHPMVPFLAQGAAMAIEDAAVLADRLGHDRAHVASALRVFEGLREHRIARVQREARRAGRLYHLWGPAAFARNFTLRRFGGERLLRRFDWLYDWRAP